MAVELEGLEFQIEAKSNEATKGVDALSSTFSKLKKVTKGGLGLNSSVKQLTNLNKALEGFHSEKLEKLSNALGSLSGAKSTIPSTLPKRISELGTSLQNLRDEDIDRLERVSNVLHGMGDLSNVRIPRVNVPTTGVAPTMTTPGNMATDAIDSGMEQATSTVQQTSAALDGLKSVATGFDSVVGISYPFRQLGQTLSSIPAKIKKVVGHLHELYSGFKKSGGMVGAFSRMMGKIFKKSAAGMAAGVKAVTSSLGKHLFPTTKKTTGALGKLLGAFKRISLYRAIRFMLSQITQALKEGINNLYQYSNAMGGTFAQSMDRLATSSQYVKNSLGAMAAPIINALAPAIDFVIDKIATLLNYINMLFARLSGASVFTAAKKSAASYGDSLSSAGGSAAQAAKEIRDATTGIDELNMIMAKDNSGGGGGGSGTDYGSMFEELPIDSNIGNLADTLKTMIAAGNWVGLGTFIGTKFNEVIASVDWAGLGDKIGYYLNAVLTTIATFIRTFDWYTLGANLGECINHIITEVDWTNLGVILGTKFRVLVEGLGGLFATIDWVALGKALADGFLGLWYSIDWAQAEKTISDGALGILTSLSTAIKSIKWQRLGNDLATLIKNIDWTGIVVALSDGIGAALGGLAALLWGLIEDAWGSVVDWWYDVAYEDGEFTMKGLLAGIWEGICNIGSWIKENIFDPFIEGFKEAFGIHSPSTVMKEQGDYIVQGLLEGILKPFRNIGKWIDTHILKPLTEAFDKDNLVDFAVGVKNDASTWWSNVKNWWSGKVGAVQQFTTSVKNDSLTWWSNVKTWWSGKCGAVQQFTTSVKNDASTWWSNVKTWWSNKVGNLSVGVSIINAASTWWSNVKSWWSQKAGSLTTTLNVKTPHIKVNWGTVTAFGKSFSYPKGFDLEWYAKGGILDGAQIFGMMGNKFLGGGEAGREAVLPLESHTEWMDTLAEKVRNGLPDDNSHAEGYYNAIQQIIDHMENLERTMNTMAGDMNRQANKKEQTTVQIGNRIVTDAVTTQQNANGYRFTK